MSLINEALQDLATRENQNASALNAKPFLQTETGPRYRTLHARKILLSLSILCLALTSYIFLGSVQTTNKVGRFASDTKNASQNKSQVQSVQGTKLLLSPLAVLPLTTQSIDSAAVPTRPTLALVQAQKMVQEPSSQNTLVAQTPSKGSEIDGLLTKAEQSFNRYRLSRPRSDSALFYIDKVLALDTENLDALELKAKVKQRYRSLVSAAIEKAEFDRANALLARAEIFDIGEHERNGLSQRLHLSEKIASEILDDAESLGKGNYISATKPDRPKVSTEVPQIDAAGVTETAASWVNVSLEQQDINTQARIKVLVAERGADAALAELSHINQIYPKFYHTRVLQADLLLAQGKTREVELMLTNIGQQHAAHAYLQSRLLVINSGEHAAINYLSSKAVLSFNEKGLLAAMYQKTKQFEKAFSLYQQLLGLQADNDTFLLGFALSADALGKHRQSAHAYRAVLDAGKQHRKVMDFIKSRLAQLNTDKLAEANVW